MRILVKGLALLLILFFTACAPAPAAARQPAAAAPTVDLNAEKTAIAAANAASQVTTTPPAPTLSASPTSANAALATAPGAAAVEATVSETAQSATARGVASAATSTPPPTGATTVDTCMLPKYWAEWPLIPTLSARAKEIFLRGQQLGNDPHSFTTIGDCQSEPNIFMGVYDTNSYQLGADYGYLEETIQQFKGSFARDSITVKDGMSVASVFSPAWADPKQCQPNETPLECEFRLQKPIIVFINLGTNWRGGDEVKHAEYMRKIVDFAISKGVVPVLGTKGDNLEGGYRINQSIAQVAYEYDMPMWNFWLSIRDLPGKGIDGTRPGGYLTPEAWGRRSFTGLQALDAVWRELKPLVK